MLAAIIQARQGSTRLPGKVLRSLGERTVLEWVIRAADQAGVFDVVVVATTTGAEDDPVADVAESAGAAVTRGSAEDVLSRYCMAVDSVGADDLVRLTADCPLLDAEVIRMAVAAFRAGAVDYVSTISPRSLPRGLDVEVLSSDALRTADREATGHHRSHVTSWLYSPQSDALRASLTFTPGAEDLRVTVDEPADLTLVRAIVSELGDGLLPWRSVVGLLRARPDLVAINAAVEQKQLCEG